MLEAKFLYSINRTVCAGTSTPYYAVFFEPRGLVYTKIPASYTIRNVLTNLIQHIELCFVLGFSSLRIKLFL